MVLAAALTFGRQTSGGSGVRRTKPRIYFLHPLLAGPIHTWSGHLARCTELGFDHLLIAPPFLPGRGGNIFTTADHDRCHPALAWDGAADEALATIAGMCREHGLRLLLDLVTERVASDGELVRARPEWFLSTDDDGLPDPRIAGGDRMAAMARADSLVDDHGLGGWWQQRLQRWIDTGVEGFRCDSPQPASAPFLKRVIGSIRQHRPDALFIAWTPGVAREDLAALAGCGFDGTVSSTAWWDYRAEWLFDEEQALRRVAPPLGLPEAPYGVRLAEQCSDVQQMERCYRRAILFAAAWGAGWILPMGMEYASPRRLDPARDQPDDFQDLRNSPALDCTPLVKAANQLCESESSAGDDSHPISSPGAAIAAVLQTAPLSSDRADRLILVNGDLASPHKLEPSPLLVRSAATGTRYRCLLPDTGEQVAPDTPIALDAGEIRVLVRESLPKTGPARRPPRAGAGKASEAPRVAIEGISPSVDGGRFPAKRLLGSVVSVEADIICDGHGVLAAALLWRHAEEAEWHERRMELLGNDRWRARFPLERLGRYLFTVEAWCDAFASFRDELTKKYGAGQNVVLEIEEGRLLVAQAAKRAEGELAQALERIAAALKSGDAADKCALLLAGSTAELMAQADDRPFAFRHEPVQPVEVDRRSAEFASWYEIFPRSHGSDAETHGTFADVIRILPRVRAMGFDVLYFPPIHPIGRTNRKGRNNSLKAAPDDPGSPYAIGAAEGGHDAVHPELGTMADFRRLREAAAGYGIELALDFAIQCAPDHPWLKAHPDWFDWRPDGSLRYAENPPKKYEDIVNVDFYAPGARPSLWNALRDVVLFWASHGVRLFRVDNPHTKPLPFWEWLIADVRGRYPDAIFLSEAFTRPKMMYRLAKLGFSQSYTYFTWRNGKHELIEYLTELTTTAPRDFFRPHFFVNTPDINPYFLQTSGRPGFLIRAALAATLSGLWGVYNGFELCEGTPLPGREEYADSEKYQLRAWDWQRPGNIVAEIARLNEIRRRNPALHSHLGISFYNAFNDNILYYGKATANRDNTILVAINLDPHHAHEADFEVPLWEWGLSDSASLIVEDLMHGGQFAWHGKMQHLRLDPAALPFAIWRVAPAGGA